MKVSQTITLIIIFFGATGLVLSQLNLLSSITTWIIVLILSLLAALASGYHRSRSTSSTVALATGGNASYEVKVESPRTNSTSFTGFGRVLPWLVLIPGVVAILSSLRMQLGPHGYLHSAYVYQILNGQTPPENILMPGTPANYYWYYHALVATLSEVTRTAPPLVATILSLVALALTIFLLYELVSHLLPQEKRPLVLTVLAFFSLFGMNLFGTIHSALRFAPAGQDLPTILTALDPQALFGDNRLSSGLSHYLGFGGWPLGLLCYVFVLLLVVRALSGGMKNRDIIFAILATFAAFALHATEGIMIAVAAPAALAVTFLVDAFLKGKLLDGAYYKEQATTAWRVMRQHWPWTLGSIVLLMVLGLSALRFLLGASGTTALSLDLLSLKGAQSIISITYPLIPFFLIGLVYAYRSADKRLIFLAAFAVIGLMMGYFINLGNNEYKLVFNATIPMCIVCTVPIWYYAFRPVDKRNLLGNVFALIMLGLMFVNILTVGLSSLVSPMAESDNFVANGTELNSRTAYTGTPLPEIRLDWAIDENGQPYPSDLQFADIFEWARDNTPVDAILVVPMAHRDTSSLYVLSERVPYILDGTTMNSLLPGYEERVHQIEQIYDPASPASAASQALDAIRANMPNRSKYLLYPLSDTVLSAAPDQYGLQLVYEGRNANLYEIETN